MINKEIGVSFDSVSFDYQTYFCTYIIHPYPLILLNILLINLGKQNVFEYKSFMR